MLSTCPTEKPELTITLSDPMAASDLFVNTKTYVINCTATGKPVPWVWWEWTECEVPDATCFPHHDPMGEGREWKVLPSRLSGPRMSEVVVDATFITSPRMLRCYANSTRFEITKKDQLFVPTGMPHCLILLIRTHETHVMTYLSIS